ncbi:META domain-containing protein [Streptomyces sp. DSM 42041]|uniref:META domain-containing protein n=1 Tax=Streptomyces hazeniae TaxID=3075538 RepID=A0ABU2P084_9ACTN|nr:META domain-containing protein [Streptomyces sp. DSM 42041]MDT0382662.1 META domain-containing protein [Streptomyces sp. DSM 42041]
MNQIRKILTSAVSVAVIATVASSCGEATNAGGQRGNTTELQRRWTPQTITFDGETLKAPTERETYVTFSSGAVKGNVGCNGFSADVSIAAHAISVSELSKTTASCIPGHRFEGKFFKIFKGEFQYAISKESELTLTREEGVIRLIVK